MAVFQFTSRRVELDFPGGIKHSLPLNEEMLHKVKSASKELLDKTSALRGKGGTEEDLETLCDYTLDAVDAILGEDAAAQIMESKKDYSYLDCLDLFKFVTDEFNAAFTQQTDGLMARSGNPTPGNQNKQTIPAPNRAQRRHRRRNK